MLSSAKSLRLHSLGILGRRTVTVRASRRCLINTEVSMRRLQHWGSPAYKRCRLQFGYSVEGSRSEVRVSSRLKPVRLQKRWPFITSFEVS